MRLNNSSVEVEETIKPKNPIIALYPLTKFYIALLVILITLLVPSLIGKIIGFAILNLLVLASGVWLDFFKKVMKSLGIIFIILVIIQTLFHPSNDIFFSFWIFSGKTEGFIFALRLGFTLLAAGGSIIWYFCITPERDFILSLEKSGLNKKAAYVILSTLQMVPVLKKKSETIMSAQKARGVETEGNLLVRAKVFIPTLIPLVLSSISSTEERSLTLEARGFSSDVTPTHYYDINIRDIDKKINIMIMVLALLAIIGRVML